MSSGRITRFVLRSSSQPRRAARSGPSTISSPAENSSKKPWACADDDFAALVRHPGLAEPLLVRSEAPAARALGALSPRHARRLAMRADEPWFARSGRATELLDVIGRHGDRALEFVWKHMAVLAGGAALAAFLAHPEPYLDGVVRLAGTAAGAAAAPATEAAREAARATNWTLLGLAGMLLLFANWLLRRARGGYRPHPSRSAVPSRLVRHSPGRPGRPWDWPRGAVLGRSRDRASSRRRASWMSWSGPVVEGRPSGRRGPFRLQLRPRLPPPGTIRRDRRADRVFTHQKSI
jgi:hypothetical protein